VDRQTEALFGKRLTQPSEVVHRSEGVGEPCRAGPRRQDGSGSDVALDDDHVYRVDSMEVETIAAGQSLPEALALWGQSAFWVNLGAFIILDYLGNGTVSHRTAMPPPC
jgi:hypothetical protein